MTDFSPLIAFPSTYIQDINIPSDIESIPVQEQNNGKQTTPVVDKPPLITPYKNQNAAPTQDTWMTRVKCQTAAPLTPSNAETKEKWKTTLG
ncbi:hypothetical protein VTJ04DRAFT_2586 [Mycothermus thermophilus]|uniref:uncharacterized protein n=1 Tax=Humicola insolens TaxID=85995 RepID=UPI00374388CD